MATLANGIETLDFGSLTWVADMNANMLLVYSIAELASIFDAKALDTHDHDLDYEVDSVTIDQTWLQDYLEVLDTDLKFTNDTEGIVLVDTAAADNKRIYIDDGVISTEVVV